MNSAPSAQTGQVSDAVERRHPWFPVWGIRLVTPRLELRPARESEMDALVRLAARGIHDPDTMPFSVPWTDAPSPRREQETYAFILGCWAGISPQGWRLPFAVCVEGAVIGMQDLAATRWGERRVAETGSWLGRDYQGAGFGTEMRAAVLHLAMGHLGAERVESTAFDDNVASVSVSRRLGYREIGERFIDRRGVPGRQLCFAIDRSDWEGSAAASIDVEVRGVDDAVLEQLGAN